jgi:hypothetical protein
MQRLFRRLHLKQILIVLLVFAAVASAQTVVRTYYGNGTPMLPTDIPDVNIKQINGVTAGTDAAEGDAVATPPVPTGCVYRSSPGTLATGDVGYLYCDPDGKLGINVSEINGVTPLMGAGATGTGSLRVTEANDSALTAALQLIDDSQTGDSVHYRTSAGSTEDEHEVKATAGRLFSVTFTNTNAAVRYWRCSNLTAANTTPGTSTVFIGLAIPGATSGAGFTHTFGPNGIAFSTALTCWFVTGAADTDVAEVAANEIKAIYSFK